MKLLVFFFKISDQPHLDLSKSTNYQSYNTADIFWVKLTVKIIKKIGRRGKYALISTCKYTTERTTHTKREKIGDGWWCVSI